MRYTVLVLMMLVFKVIMTCSAGAQGKGRCVLVLGMRSSTSDSQILDMQNVMYIYWHLQLVLRGTNGIQGITHCHQYSMVL